ncbi:MAG: sigma 54-interacting transcriptional regulator [Kofleriaceae bacterium]
MRVLSITFGGKTTHVELTDGQELTVGRTAECEIVLDDRMVSRRHAVLRGRATLEVEDLGSHNGTVVVMHQASGHGETLTARSASVRLEPGVPVEVGVESMIQIGSASITVELPSTSTVIADPAMARLYELARRVAPSDLSVLVLGETGVGKDVLAHHLHEQSTRADHKLLTLNCGAVPENLLEAELFGYEKGAFTGAVKLTPGLLESADRGTVFLDEVGELSPAFQVKLLRVLETGAIMRVGGREPVTIDVRYIAATNRDLAAEIAAGRFREDLYYRLNGITLVIPPLRERRDEILSLAKRFLGESHALSVDAAALLEGYHWPGNVRQLRAVIRRAAVLCRGSIVAAEHIQLSDQPAARIAATSPASPAASPEELRDLAEQLEKQRIIDTLDAVGGNQTRAAEKLGLTRRALVIRLDKYGITRPRKAT